MPVRPAFRNEKTVSGKLLAEFLGIVFCVWLGGMHRPGIGTQKQENGTGPLQTCRRSDRNTAIIGQPGFFSLSAEYRHAFPPSAKAADRPVCCFRYASGESPITSRKALANLEPLSNPTLPAISKTL